MSTPSLFFSLGVIIDLQRAVEKRSAIYGLGGPRRPRTAVLVQVTFRVRIPVPVTVSTISLFITYPYPYPYPNPNSLP